MPGKYPLITSPDSSRETLTAGGTVGLSRSDRNILKGMFPNSPIYTSMDGGTQSDAAYRTYAASYLQNSTQTDDRPFPDFSTPVDMDYTGVPDFTKDLEVDGVPFDSPYYPNRNLNGVDPAGGDGAATGVAIEPNDNFGSGNTITAVLPTATAPIIAATTIDVTGPIAKSGKSGNATTDTHTINPGADGVGATTL